MLIDECKQRDIQVLLEMCYKIYKNYSWLSDSYVSDFYVCNYWKKLPRLWKDLLKSCTLFQIGNIINFNSSLESLKVLPLSMLALRQLIKCLHIQRNQVTFNVEVKDCLFPENKAFSVDQFRNVFWKRIKQKKKHEIELMAKMSYKLAVQTKCFCIIDVGSGIGHLSRLLSYRYGFKVCGLEAQEYLTEEARKLDEKIENALKKYCNGISTKYTTPVHINITINTTSNGEDIIKIAEEVFKLNDNTLEFGIVGLHPCGDLSTSLLQLFVKYSQVKFINIVGCCYMKLSDSKSSLYGGYPISEFCKERNYKLSYISREAACHAIELYADKLCSGNCQDLRIHSYRALLEKLIVDDWPELCHSQVMNVKYHDGLSFPEYSLKAVSRLGIKLNKSKIESSKIKTYLKKWNLVVIFYSLRLMIAPLIETIIILDRILFVIESGNACSVTSIFDPKISPRNLILTAAK